MGGVTLMFLLFAFIVFSAIALMWYNKKYSKKIDVGKFIIGIFFLVAVAFFILIKYLSGSEKDAIIKNIALKNTVIEIITDTHKHYFKSMKMDNGRVLPMPEAMNTVLQIGDSIYKSKGEAFYTIVNPTIKTPKKFEVKVHERVLSKPQ